MQMTYDNYGFKQPTPQWNFGDGGNSQNVTPYFNGNYGMNVNSPPFVPKSMRFQQYGVSEMMASPQRQMTPYLMANAAESPYFKANNLTQSFGNSQGVLGDMHVNSDPILDLFSRGGDHNKSDIKSSPPRSPWRQTGKPGYPSESPYSTAQLPNPTFRAPVQENEPSNTTVVFRSYHARPWAATALHKQFFSPLVALPAHPVFRRRRQRLINKKLTEIDDNPSVAGSKTLTDASTISSEGGYSRKYMIEIGMKMGITQTLGNIQWHTQYRDQKPGADPRRVRFMVEKPQRVENYEEKPRNTSTRLTPSANAYRIEVPKDRAMEINRAVRSLLNKICPENLNTIVDQLAQITILNASEMDQVIRIIFKKALCDIHYSETYADMVFHLRDGYPEFPPVGDQEKPITFTRILLAACQDEFESSGPLNRETCATGEYEFLAQEKKKSSLTLMRFVGNLYLRSILATRVVSQVLHDLTHFGPCKSLLPDEYNIECALELMKSVGYTMESSDLHASVVETIIARLTELKDAKNDENKAVYSKRVQFMIQDLLDLRCSGWEQKVFKEAAKKKKDIKLDLAMEARHSRSGASSTKMIVGQRPKYMDDSIKQARASFNESVFTVDKVKQILQSYVDDRNVCAFCFAWDKMEKTSDSTLLGLKTILEIGFTSRRLYMESYANAIEVLLKSKSVSIDQVEQVLKPQLERLEETKLDHPSCELFFFTLVMRLCFHVKETAKTTFTSAPLNPAVAWDLYIGAIRHCYAQDGVEACQILLPYLEKSLTRAGNCRIEEVKRRLRHMGLLKPK